MFAYFMKALYFNGISQCLAAQNTRKRLSGNFESHPFVVADCTSFAAAFLYKKPPLASKQVSRRNTKTKLGGFALAEHILLDLNRRCLWVRSIILYGNLKDYLSRCIALQTDQRLVGILRIEYCEHTRSQGKRDHPFWRAFKQLDIFAFIIRPRTG